jgi:putative aminopeptidase FrvX
MADFSASRLFELIERLVYCHSPSGAEEEIDILLKASLAELGLEHEQDAAGNIIARIPGRDDKRTLAITAHKDEIAAIVKEIDPHGRVSVRKLGGAFPWVYGEGVVDLLGDRQVVSGILSFGSRHVSHESPQKCHQEDKALKWEHVWVETKMSPEELLAAGIRPGTRMVIGKHRKAPFRLGEYLASYTLDNKASVAILLWLAERLRQPVCEVLLAFTAREEVGAFGAMYLTNECKVDELIALEICPKSDEYPLPNDRAPVLVSQDGHGLYDENLNRALAESARSIGLNVQHALLNGFGSDASIVMKNGHVPKAACLGFPTDNTHGYEIAHPDAILGCLYILEAYCTPAE